MFRQLGFRLRKPRPAIAQADPERQKAHKKTPRTDVSDLEPCRGMARGTDKSVVLDSKLRMIAIVALNPDTPGPADPLRCGYVLSDRTR